MSLDKKWLDLIDDAYKVANTKVRDMGIPQEVIMYLCDKEPDQLKLTGILMYLKGSMSNKEIDMDENMSFEDYQRMQFNKMWNHANGIPTERDLIILQNIQEEKEFLK